VKVINIRIRCKAILGSGGGVIETSAKKMTTLTTMLKGIRAKEMRKAILEKGVQNSAAKRE
jgi:hypothetical protein